MPDTTQTTQLTSKQLGGKKAAEKNTANNPNFYKDIGKKGGEVSTGGGFGQGEAGKARAKQYGRLGGSIGKIGYKYLRGDGMYRYYENKLTGKIEQFEYTYPKVDA